MKDGFVLVDGKQRIQALRKFFNNEIRVFGSLYSEFTDKMSVTDHNIKINVNTLQTKADVLRWYVDMNAGGTPHTQAEIDKALRLLYEAENPTANNRKMSAGEARERVSESTLLG